ncbi:hypothetical protein ACP70R_034349 [Stipagrostis hirtigluma subsp. patula]
MEHVAKFLFGISGNVIALFLFLSPANLLEDHQEEVDRGLLRGAIQHDTPQLPPVSLRYGLPFVSPNNILVSTINGTGAAIEIVYVVVFIAFASSQRTRLKTLGLAAAVAAVFAAVALVSLLALHGQGRKLLCGLAATVCSICMYASPLSIMRLVVKTKSVEFMPFLLSLAVFLCGTSWFVYGLLGRDPFVAIPNGCGSFLGAVQLILYAIYRNSGKAGSGASAGAGRDGKPQGDADVEMADAKSSTKVADDAVDGTVKEVRQV